MKSNYETIIRQNLELLFTGDLQARCLAADARMEGGALAFRAFGAGCRITPDEIRLDDQTQTGPLGIILSLYALHAVSEPLQMEPFKAFKETPDSAPYAGAFATHTEQILVPKVAHIMENRGKIMERLDGREAPAHIKADAAMVVRPLPKIALCYIFYAADEDFPASVTCLYSHNACRFMPVDGLADVGEYTSRQILAFLA